MIPFRGIKKRLRRAAGGRISRRGSADAANAAGGGDDYSDRGRRDARSRRRNSTGGSGGGLSSKWRRCKSNPELVLLARQQSHHKDNNDDGDKHNMNNTRSGASSSSTSSSTHHSSSFLDFEHLDERCGDGDDDENTPRPSRQRRQQQQRRHRQRNRSQTPLRPRAGSSTSQVELLIDGDDDDSVQAISPPTSFRRNTSSSKRCLSCDDLANMEEEEDSPRSPIFRLVKDDDDDDNYFDDYKFGDSDSDDSNDSNNNFTATPSSSSSRRAAAPIRWRTLSGDRLSVRSSDYSRTRRKLPSPGELYDCVKVDFVESETRLANMSSRVELPRRVMESDDGDQHAPPVKPACWHAPEIFVVSLSLPREPSAPVDGPSYTITMYFTMKQATRDVLQQIYAEKTKAATQQRQMNDPDDHHHADASSSSSSDGHNDDSSSSSSSSPNINRNAIRLFDEWCRRSSEGDAAFQGRFKIIPQAQNIDDLGLPRWIARWNGKPVLIKRTGLTGFVYNNSKDVTAGQSATASASPTCMEMEVSFHPFPWAAKQAISYIRQHVFHKAMLSLGFVIEGRDEETELPEVLMGLCQLCFPHPDAAIKATDFFAVQTDPGTTDDHNEEIDHNSSDSSTSSTPSSPATADAVASERPAVTHATTTAATTEAATEGMAPASWWSYIPPSPFCLL